MRGPIGGQQRQNRTLDYSGSNAFPEVAAAKSSPITPFFHLSGQEPLLQQGVSRTMDNARKLEIVRPVDLTHTAAAIARNYQDKGAIIITSGEHGIRVGVHGLDLRECEDALCTAIYDVVSKALA